jgi:hypothetical protein
VAKASAGLGGEVPSSVTVQSYLGTPAQILLRESQDAELLVVAPAAPVVIVPMPHED